MVTREEFLQLKSIVQELRSDMRKLQLDVLQRLAQTPADTTVVSYEAISMTVARKCSATPRALLACANAKEVWLEMDLIDPLLVSCLWSEVGLTQNDSLYILVGSDKNTPTAILQYTMEQLAQCECSCYVALDKMGSTGWNLKVELQSFNSIATSVTISMTSSFSPHHLLIKQLELLYEGGTFRPGHVTCLSNPVMMSCVHGPELEMVDYSKGRKNDYQCVTHGCPVVLQQLGHTSVSSTRKLANGSVMCRGKWNCEQVFMAKDILLEGGRSQEWLETSNFFSEPTSTATWKISLAIQFGDDPPDYTNARKAHPSLPQPLHLRVTFVDHDNRTSSLRLEQCTVPKPLLIWTVLA
eukprot:Em0001g2516a